MKYRFHVLAVQHTVSSEDYLSCAYTQKVVKFCRMMTARGHTVIHYGHERSRVDCTEHVSVVSDETFSRLYGHDWTKTFFTFDQDDEVYREFQKRAIAGIATRKRPLDFVLAFWGCAHKAVCDAHPDLIAVEPGIGYFGHATFARWRIYESYALMHQSAERPNTAMDWYHAVVPNYFDVTDFDFAPEDKAVGDEAYFLYVGRLTECKGVKAAIQATKDVGVRLVVAGQGSAESVGLTSWPDHVEFVGYADLKTRRRLMSRAKGAFVLSHYLEPFGGVSIEHMLSGTPVITTDWGAFAENVLHGVTGYRCRTYEHILWAARNICDISPRACRDWAAANFSLDKVASMYEEYFRGVRDVYTGDGWYQRRDDRAELDWLSRSWP